jgi:type IV pilus assembly protein PilO
MSELGAGKGRAASFNLKEQLTALNLHWAGVGLLGLVNLYLLIHMGILWQTAKSQDADAQAQQKIELQLAIQAAKPLDGLDGKLRTADEQADEFYAERLPVSWSEILTENGALAKKDNVRLTNVQYAQQPVTDVSAGPLTEVKMNASLGGDYRSLVEFINGLERDKVFFIINGVTLTGQESGRVNLRLKATTYLRGLTSDEEAQRASTPVSVEVEPAVAAPAGAAANVPGGRR